METESTGAGSEAKLKTVGLYGGTFEIGMPPGILDCSTIRQVPNHQEFYANTETGMNIITEINEFNGKVADDKASEFYFHNLAKDTYAKEVKIITEKKDAKENMPGCKGLATSFIIGDHVVNQRVDNKGAEMRVRVHMAVVRIKEVKADMLIIISLPISSNLSNNEGKKMAEQFLQLLKTFKINSLAVFKEAASK
eukprot:CAMPEP_0167757224 /NCGR_PEP_ID=MMETSP0110_2-20121227/9808_1 /TAXON_ID=629695 /ORGANISM="Gymnochlora sp., Strain CCMP2014" /LENGTH=194 /DNA_ID=CAMNT_0007643393 /DNA_START=18 /DNA_END=602 /DNA_ORIENTATION=-